MTTSFITNTSFDQMEEEELTRSPMVSSRSVVVDQRKTHSPQQLQIVSISSTKEWDDCKEPETVSLPHQPTTYRRDQTFRSKAGQTNQDVHDAVCIVLESYNKLNGDKTFSKYNVGTVQKLEWHNTGSQKDDHLNGKFSFTYCHGIKWCQVQLNIYKTERGYCVLEMSCRDGDRPTYHTIFDLISRDLMGNNGRNTDVLQGMLCPDFYPLCPMPTDTFCDLEFDSLVDPFTPEEMNEIKEFIHNALKRFTEARYYNNRMDAVDELIQLLDTYSGTFVDCCIQDKGANFLKAWCRSYRRESDIPLARRQLIFIEKLATQASDDLVLCMNGQVNGVFPTIFESWSNWREGGRYRSSWIMEDQIGRTILTLRNKGFHATLRAGRRIPVNYMKKQIEKFGPAYVRSFKFDLREVIEQTYSHDFEQQLEIYDNPACNKALKQCSNISYRKGCSNAPSHENYREECSKPRSPCPLFDERLDLVCT